MRSDQCLPLDLEMFEPDPEGVMNLISEMLADLVSRNRQCHAL